MVAPTGDLSIKLVEKRNLFLSLIRQFPGISRHKCSQMMRMSTFSSSKLVPELIAEGLITEENNIEVPTRGRPTKPLHINQDYEYFAGIDIEAAFWRFVIIDFQGDCIFSITNIFNSCDSPRQYILQLKKLLEDAIDKAGEKWKKVRAVGVGAPGFFDKKSGIIESYEVLPGFTNIPLLEIYKKVSSKPVFIINNIDNLAIYDLLKRPESKELSVIHVAIRAGISSALSLRGTIHTGSNNMAGEAGLSLFLDNEVLQESSGLFALHKQLPDLSDEFWNGSSVVVERELRKKQNKKIIENALRRIAITLANISIFIDPDELIIYSTIFSEQNQLWDVLVKQFYLCRHRQGIKKLTIRCSRKSEFVPAIGAAIFALNKIYLN